MMEYKQKIRDELPKVYSQDLLNNLFRHPYTKIDFVCKELSVTRPTASSYLNQLACNGLLSKMKLGRDNFYLNTKLFDLLINAFHMDEYIGLPQDAPQRFGTYLREHIMGCVPFRSVHYLDGSAQNILEECRRYAALLRRFPVDIVCLGIGENGHIAFNDPHTALFQDPEAVKRVTLDLTCRNQQVHDGCFSSLEVVPEQAVTLTIPSLFAGRYLFCMVPGEKKAAAVKRTVEGKIEEACPASILRCHPNAILYVDEASGALLGKDP